MTLGGRVGFLACLAIITLALGAPAAIAKVRHHTHHPSAASATKTHHRSSSLKQRTRHGRKHIAGAANARHQSTARGHHHLDSRHAHAPAHAATAKRHAQLCQEVMSHGEWVSRCR